MTFVEYKEISETDYENLSDKSGNYRIVWCYKDGNIKTERYLVNGKLHQEENKPAYIEYYESGLIRIERYLVNGNLHREGNKPAYIGYYENGIVRVEQFYVNNKLHREENKPACIGYHENGKIFSKQFYVNGIRHRENEPSYVSYYDNGTIKIKEYCVNGILHREDDKPAFIGCCEDGTILEKVYYLFGQELSEEEFFSEKISLIRNMLSEVKEFDLKQKMFQRMFEDNR